MKHGGILLFIFNSTITHFYYHLEIFFEMLKLLLKLIVVWLTEIVSCHSHMIHVYVICNSVFVCCVVEQLTRQLQEKRWRTESETRLEVIKLNNNHLHLQLPAILTRYSGGVSIPRSIRCCLTLQGEYLSFRHHQQNAKDTSALSTLVTSLQHSAIQCTLKLFRHFPLFWKVTKISW